MAPLAPNDETVSVFDKTRMANEENVAKAPADKYTATKSPRPMSSCTIQVSGLDIIRNNTRRTYVSSRRTIE